MSESDYRFLKCFYLMIAAAVFCVCLVHSSRAWVALSVSTAKSEASMAADVHALVLPMQKASGDIAAAALTLAQVGQKERDAFAQQQSYYRDLSTHTDKLLEDSDGAIAMASRVLVPKVAGVLDSATRSLDDTGDSVRKVAQAASDGLSGVRPVLDALEADATEARPGIEKLSSTAGHLDGVSANLETETGLMVGATKKALAPKNKVLTALSALFHGTITVAEFYYYISH